MLKGKTIVNPVVKDEVTYVHTAQSTNGEKTVMDIQLEPGGGTPLHYHKTYDETFEVLSGELMIQIGKQKKKLCPGEKITVKRNETHRFYSESKSTTKFRAYVIPAHEGFEKTLAIGYGLAADGLVTNKGVPKNFRHLAIMTVMSGMNLPGLLSSIEWVLEIVANSKKSKKFQEELIEKYCQ